MEKVIGGNSIVQTTTCMKNVWKGLKYNIILTPDGMRKVVKELFDANIPQRTYTIETYAKTIKIECSPKTKVKTEKGYKEIDKLKAKDVLVIKGVFVPFKLTAVKGVKRSREFRDLAYGVEVVGNSDVVVNDIIVKL